MKNLDQFYTCPAIAKKCVDVLNSVVDTNNYIFIEPSAGSGSFYNLMPADRRYGMDLEPKCEGIAQMDFFKYIYKGTRRVIVLGNPPFGKNSSMAMRFFNHAASMPEVDYIAFIIPKTFRKNSLQNKLSMNFSIIHDIDLPDNSFLKGGVPYKVPSCFQVWKRNLYPRQPKIVDLTNDWFEFVARNNSPDLAVRRVGRRAGICTDNIQSCKLHSWHFLKLKAGVSKKKFMQHINKLYSEKKFLIVASQSAGARSISFGELVEILRSFPLTNEGDVLSCRYE
ncbi:MAG TPA: hypothetical protein PLC59_06495 [Bacteroidales bacterium]|jgi:hypothetical protein|nr:hypothetical protein [Bacteroidales bacterium]HQI45684.1 hypothetical protein [Bacteroidales bacterium]